jgi:hypothetical protein
MGVRKELAPMIYVTGHSTNSEEIGADLEWSYQPRKPFELMDTVINHYIITVGNFSDSKESRNWCIRWGGEVTHLPDPYPVLYPYMRYIAAGGIRIKNLSVLLTLPFYESCSIQADYPYQEHVIHGTFPNVFSVPKSRLAASGELVLFGAVGFKDKYKKHRYKLLNELQRKGLLE